jgi:hypothetical protein
VRPENVVCPAALKDMALAQHVRRPPSVCRRHTPTSRLNRQRDFALRETGLLGVQLIGASVCRSGTGLVEPTQRVVEIDASEWGCQFARVSMDDTFQYN